MSASTQNLFVRGASPATIGMSMAGVPSKDFDSVVSSCEHAIGTVKSTNDLIDTIPQRFRVAFAPLLRAIQTTHGKYCNAVKALESLRTHQKNGTWPTFLHGMKNPISSLQFTKVSEAVLKSSVDEASTWFNLLREEALNKAIALKEKETKHLLTICTPVNVEKEMVKLLTSHKADYRKSLGKFIEDDGVGIHLPDFVQKEYLLAEKLIPAWVTKSWDFTRIKAEKTERDLASKRELLASADVEMKDAVAPELQKTIDDAVQAALRQKNKPAANKRGRPQGKGKAPQKQKKTPSSGPNQKPKKKLPSGLKSSAKKIGKRPRAASGKGSGPPPKKRN